MGENNTTPIKILFLTIAYDEEVYILYFQRLKLPFNLLM